MLKIVLLVALVPLALGVPVEEMLQKWHEYQHREEHGGGEHGMNGGGEQRQHEGGDGDCHSEEEAMMKNYELYKQMQKMKEQMEKKHEMEKAKEKMKAFYEWSEKMEKEKEKEEMEEKHRMWMMMQKQEEERQKMEKENEFNHLIESFTQQKAKFAFGLTHHFLTMCKCGEIDYQMNQMFAGEHMGNNSGVMDGMGDHDIMDYWNSGNYEEVARMLKMMSKEEQKKMYMSNLIKAMCAGARKFIDMSKQFELTYMSGNTPDPQPQPQPQPAPGP